MSNTWRIISGDTIAGMRTLPDGCVNTCITSPPYWGLRDYGHDGQIGLESTPAEYVARMVEVFREVRRVLRDDGTLWLNLGDSYAANTSGGTSPQGGTSSRPKIDTTEYVARRIPIGLKPKDLVGIPWRVAFALQDDGWYLRQDIIWHKPNPMPESVTDRCTKAHEYIFLLAKSAKYHFDSKSIAEPAAFAGQQRGGSTNRYEQNAAGMDNKIYDTRNKRSVWTVCTEPYPGAHFATFPTALIEPCVKAGCPVGGTVLDPFNGSGTTGEVSLLNGRNYIGCELNPEYVAMSRERLAGACPLLAMEVA